MTLIVPNLSITNFRSFRKLDIGPFGRVNLITGKNNAGKSSLLEAICLLVTEGSTETICNLIDNRNEIYQATDEATVDDISAFFNLFSGFPTSTKSVKPICISTTDDSTLSERKIEVFIGLFVEDEKDPAGPRTRRVEVSDLGETNVFPALEIQQPNRQRILRADRIRISRKYWKLLGGGLPGSCIFLDPFSAQRTSQLGVLWDKITLTDAEDEVVRTMKIIAPDIEKISMIGSNSRAVARTAIAKSMKFDHPVPLRNFGDGANRLFGLVLSLACARGGVLLVDEIENGFHYSILPDVWRAIFRLASDLNVQVFATTHNWDCIDAFQIAASEHPEEGVLARLTVKDDQVIPTLFREDELRIITRDRIEVR